MKKIKTLVLALSNIIMLVGCSSNLMVGIYDNETKIASLTNSFNLDGVEQEIDNQNFTATIKKMEGMDTIWILEAKEDMEVDMTYLLSVSEGKAKLVLISPNDSVTTLIETTKKTESDDYATNVLLIKKGLNRIKIVAGKNTKIDFDITILSGEFKEIGF